MKIYATYLVCWNYRRQSFISFPIYFVFGCVSFFHLEKFSRRTKNPTQSKESAYTRNAMLQNALMNWDQHNKEVLPSEMWAAMFFSSFNFFSSTYRTDREQQNTKPQIHGSVFTLFMHHWKFLRIYIRPIISM